MGGSRGGRASTVRLWLAWGFVLLAALALIGRVALLIHVYLPENPLFIDWSAYALGTQRVLAGEPLYLPEQLAGPYYLPELTPHGYIYPPPSALLFLPFSIDGIGLVAWVAGNAIVFVSGLAAVIWREFGRLPPVPYALALLGVAVAWPLPDGLWMAPFADGIVNANVNVALAGLLAWCWAAGERRRWIPYVAGIAAVFKIFPGALALWAARRHGWRAIAITAGVGLIIVLATLPVVALDSWNAFLLALSNAEPTCDGGRISIACTLLPFVGTSAAKLAGIVIGAILLGLSLVVRREFPAFVLLTAGMLAPMADGHPHYWLFAYVLLVIAAARLSSQPWRIRQTVGVSSQP